MKKHYNVLGLTLDATSDDLKRAYRDLSKKYHPDLCVAVSKEIAEEKFKEINEAYAKIKKHMRKAKTIENSEENAKNEKSKYDLDMIYDLVQMYIVEAQLKPLNLKFPNKETLYFYETDTFFMIEGYYFSKNWINQSVKTGFRISLFKNFKLNKLDFLKTDIVTERESNFNKTKNRRRSEEIDDRLKSYTEKEKIYKCIKRFILEMNGKSSSCVFPEISSLTFYTKDNKIIVKGFFSFTNNSTAISKKEYKACLNLQYEISKFELIDSKSRLKKDYNYSHAYEKYREKKEEKIKSSIVINLDFLKNKFLYVMVLIFTLFFLILITRYHMKANSTF